MGISSVGNHSYTGAMPAFSRTAVHRAQGCSCEDGTAASPGTVETGDVRAGRGEGHGHHRHLGHRSSHDGGSGYGHFAMGMGRFFREQMQAARREVTGEKIDAAVADLTAQVAGVIEDAGQSPDLAAAQESFSAAVQDVVDHFDSGDIGRRRAMAGFHAAFEDLVSAIRPSSEGDASAVNAADVAGAADTGVADPVPAVAAVAVAADGTGPGISLVDSLGDVFNSFLKGLRSDLAALDGMRTIMSPENRATVVKAFVDLYRELAGADAQQPGSSAAADGIDQLA